MLYNYRIENARGEIVFYPWEKHFRLHIRPINAPSQYYAFPIDAPEVKIIAHELGIG